MAWSKKILHGICSISKNCQRKLLLLSRFTFWLKMITTLISELIWSFLEKQVLVETISCKFLCLSFSIWSWIILARETEDKIINTYPTNPSASIGICNCRAIITDCCCVTYKESPWKTIQYLSNSETAEWKAFFGRKFSYLFCFHFERNWPNPPASRPVSCCCGWEDERAQ